MIAYEFDCRLTGERWRVIIDCVGAPSGHETAQFTCDRANITFFNLVCLKSKLGYCGRAFLYYKERCGRNTAALVPLDYDHQIPAMLQSNSKDRKIRILLTRDQQTNLQVTITPLKRRRETTTEGRRIGEQIDAYKIWLQNLQQDEPDTGRYNSSSHNLYKLCVVLSIALTYSLRAEFKDDYRDETIETYKEWLRRKEYLQDISNFYSFIQQSKLILLVNKKCID